MHTVEADLNDGAAVRSLLTACRPTHVLHLAAQAGVRYAAKNPQAYVASNVAGFVSLMEALKEQAQPAGFLGFSGPLCGKQHPRV